MQVYLCKEVYYDFCNIYETVVKVFDDEVKALVWKEEQEPTETEWRTYEEMEVE